MRAVRGLLIAAIFGVAVVGGLVYSAATPRAGEALEVVVVEAWDNRFWPDVIAVAVGTTVVWSNIEPDPANSHDVLLDNRMFESVYFLPGETVAFRFDFPGDFLYYCDLHEGMYGRVIVQ